MAVVTPAPAAIPARRPSPMRFPEFREPEIMAGRREIVEEEEEEGAARVIDEKVYVAVGKTVKDCRSVLIWALHKSGGKRVCVIHVHQPAQMIPLMGGKFPANTVKEQEVRAYREIERQNMHKVLDEYLRLCRGMGVRAEKLPIEMESIEEGILKLISEHGIKELVMGAASNKRYSRNMTEIKSRKAISVCQQAPASCHIWFVCKGDLIYTKEGILETSNTRVGQQASPDTLPLQLNYRRPHSTYVKPSNPVKDLLRRAMSTNSNGRAGRTTTRTCAHDVGGLSTLPSRSDTEGSSDECDSLLRRSTSQSSVLSPCSSTGMTNVALVPCERTEGSEIESEINALPQPEELHHSSPPSVLDGGREDPLYDQLEQAINEATNSRREAFKEADRRAKVEKDAMDAIHRARAMESLYLEESKRRKEIEETLAKEKVELEKIKNEQDEAVEELHMALDRKSLLESQIAESDQMVQELEQKILSAVELLQNYKRERDELQMERDNALKEAEELRKSRAEASSTHTPQIFTEFSFSEIEEATHNFNQSLKIGEGGYGSIYKGVLCHTQVAIKMLHSYSLQGPAEFQQEVDVLSKMRHPNLVTLIGACPEAWILIYEYLSNGSLEDRLRCSDNSPPLSWQARIRIAAELCSVLIFLHSSKPHSIVHGDLKPANILLDSNCVSKLSDFGICRLIAHDEGLSNNTTICCRTDPKGTFAYMDPEFLASGELTPKSDVYSFGIILLRLLTGRPALGIMKEVQYALDKGNLNNLLDPLAGDWPFVQAEQLANLALRCCEMNRKSRPDLASEVWKVLEPMKASCGGSSCFRLGSEEHCQPPPYFICPIFQEVMRDPHVAADGFTYEAEALKGWLDAGHDTSPMTNQKLEHNNLTPNRALRSAIQEWLHQQ